jgi:hypothetical protein
MFVVMIIVLVCIAFVVGLASSFARSPSRNPLAELSIRGQTAQASVLSIQRSSAGVDVEIEYVVNGTAFRRVVPWPGDEQSPPPMIGSQVTVRYLPNDPGASRIERSVF